MNETSVEKLPARLKVGFASGSLNALGLKTLWSISEPKPL